MRRRVKLQAAPIDGAALTAEQARAYLQVGKNTMGRLLASGELRSFVVGERGRRISRQALDEYIARAERRREGSGSGSGDAA